MRFQGTKNTVICMLLAAGMMAGRAVGQIPFAQTINTINGIPNSGGYTGDGGAARLAKIQNSIRYVVYDRQGNAYFTDAGTTTAPTQRNPGWFR